MVSESFLFSFSTSPVICDEKWLFVLSGTFSLATYSRRFLISIIPLATLKKSSCELGYLKKFAILLILSVLYVIFSDLSLRSRISFPSSATRRFSSFSEERIFDLAFAVTTKLNQSSLGVCLLDVMIST